VGRVRVGGVSTTFSASDPTVLSTLAAALQGVANIITSAAAGVASRPPVSAASASQTVPS
jgi:hypothetical protein